MEKRKKQENLTWLDRIVNSTGGLLAIAIVSMALGIVFIVSQFANKPITREEAVAYVGEFQEYEVWDNYRTLHFTDGSTYEVYAHTEKIEFQNKMRALPKGTHLSLLVNPNNNYVIEIYAQGEELMNFETSQKEIDSYGKGYIFIGVFIELCGICLIAYTIGMTVHKRGEKAKENEKKQKRKASLPDTPLRIADLSARSRILLEATEGEYKILYRRLKSTNELVINGSVYDEKKGFFEYEHRLIANVGGHRIAAGLDKAGFSYIRFDGQYLATKKRSI